jgi:hypothetical protein
MPLGTCFPGYIRLRNKMDQDETRLPRDEATAGPIALHEIFSRKGAKTQRRPPEMLCAFPPLRENYSSYEVKLDVAPDL